MVNQAEAHLKKFHADVVEVKNPVTGKVFASVPNLKAEAVEQAVQRARQAQVGWAAMPVEQRCQILKRFADLLLAQQNQIIEIIQRESGKNFAGAYSEVVVVVFFVDYFAKYAPRWLKTESRRAPFPLLFSARVHRKPYGVVGNISPWNFPLMLCVADMIPALLAGNAVVVKPSELTPFSALEIGRVLKEAGLPDNVFQVVTGYGETGAALIEVVDYIMFTGSTATGRKVAARAGERLIPCTMELGGKDPMIILKDADINTAAAAAFRGGMENTGQICISTERVFVEEAVYDEFLAALKKWYRQFTIGMDKSFEMHMGSMTHEREFERVQTHVQGAINQGARLLVGGSPLPQLGPLFFEPTVIVDAKPDMEIMCEETFGPVIAVMKVKDADEAVRLANQSRYGLSASIWSRDVRKAEALASRLESGVVNINTVFMEFGTPSVEMAGVKESGVGGRNGKQGLLKYTRPQSIVVDNYPRPALTAYNLMIKRLFELNRKLQRFFPFLGG